jgi:hypothetical protein
MADANTIICVTRVTPPSLNDRLSLEVGSDQGSAGGSGMCAASTLSSHTTHSCHTMTPLRRNDLLALPVGA